MVTLDEKSRQARVPLHQRDLPVLEPCTVVPVVHDVLPIGFADEVVLVFGVANPLS